MCPQHDSRCVKRDETLSGKIVSFLLLVAVADTEFTEFTTYIYIIYNRLKFKGQGSLDREGHIKTERESMKTMAQPLMDFLTSK